MYNTLRILVAVAGLTVLSNAQDVVVAGTRDWESPRYNYIFRYPLPIMPEKAPLTSFTDVNKTIDFYDIEIKEFQSQVYPNLGPTTFVGYDGMVPGPTFRVTKNRESVVRFINHAKQPSSIHLHGSFSRAPFDGWAEDVTNPDQYKDYYYPNQQAARTLWYHDHALGVTAVNAYYGQAGFYILDDPAENFGLPTGKYDIPLMISGVQFKSDGSLFSPAAERDSLYGDVILVNGQPWPYLNVEPRKYRFRLLDASISRSFSLFLVQDPSTVVFATGDGSTDANDPTLDDEGETISNIKTRIPFTVVGSDAGIMSKPVTTDNLVLSMAERWEIIIDFSAYAGRSLTLMNERDFQTNEDYIATDKVIRFQVGTTVTDSSNNGELPAQLAALSLPEEHTTVDQSFEFERKNGEWRINGVGFEDVTNRILANPKRGTVQRWRLINSSGGWSHPIHVHLIDFQILSRTGGRKAVTAYEAASLKDVVYLGENESVDVLANYAPWSGVYMFHCHNLVHEDHDMMAAFNVTDVDLSAYGYGDLASFGDPMQEEFRAKPYLQETDIADVETNVLPALAALNVYPLAEHVHEALKEALAALRARHARREAYERTPTTLKRVARVAQPTAV